MNHRPLLCPPFGLRTLPLAAWLVLGLAACSPDLNWRQVRTDAASVSLLLPCKPDRARKTVPLGAQASTLSMVGCEAGGATFALAVLDLAPDTEATQVLLQWQSLTLSNMRAASHTQAPVKIAGAAAEPAARRVVAHGQQADGRAVQSQAVYFVRGAQLFQAVIYAPRISAEAADTFFGGIKLE